MPTTPNSPDVLVVGAGPVGLTIAASLHHHGLTPRLIDKAPAPSDKSKALVVWSRTLELLSQLGLADRFIATGLKINGAQHLRQRQATRPRRDRRRRHALPISRS